MNSVNSSNFNATIHKFSQKYQLKFLHVFIFGNMIPDSRGFVAVPIKRLNEFCLPSLIIRQGEIGTCIFDTVCHHDSEETCHQTFKHAKIYSPISVEGPLYEITEQEVEKALKEMKNDRAAGPSGLTSDMLKYAGHTGMLELLRVFQKILRNGTVPM